MAYVTQAQDNAHGYAQKSKALWASLVVRYTNYRTYRNTLSELRGLSDRELSDLGLNRSTLKSVAMEAAYDR